MYVRPSHRAVDKLMKLTGDPAAAAAALNSDCKSRDESSQKQTKCNLAIWTLHRGLFLENIDIIRDIARDCVKIFSRLDARNEGVFLEEPASQPYLIRYIQVLMDRETPAKSLLRTTFRQVMGFITAQNRGSLAGHINYLLSFVNELRVSHSTLPLEDKKMVKILLDDSVGSVLDVMSKDASLLLYWACVEVARYSVNETLISKDISVNDFLVALDNELSKPGKFSEKFLKRFFVIFIQNLEKAVHRDLECSLRRNSFISSNASSKSLTAVPYNQILNQWIANNRERMANYSLQVEDPAECWRSIDLKLSSDLALKRKSFTSMGLKIPFEKALESLNARNWRKNLALIGKSAIQLNDLDLLYGIESLVNDSGLICDFPPLSSMISNLEENFERTHIDLIDKCNDDLDEQSLIEFLKACVEMNLLKENSSAVDLLESQSMKDLYKRCIQSTEDTQLPLESRLAEVKQWLQTWSDSSEPQDIDLMMSAYLSTVSKPPQELLPASHDEAEWFLSQNFIAQTLFSPSRVSSNFKVYNILFELLKMKDEEKCIPADLVRIHGKNLHWNNLLFRHIRNLNCLDALRQQDGQKIDLVQYRAVKYHRKCNNTLTALSLSDDFMRNGTSCKLKIECSLLMLPETESTLDRYKSILSEIELKHPLSSLKPVDRNDLKLKVLRNCLRSPMASEQLALSFSYEKDSIKIETAAPSDQAHLSWQESLNSSKGISRLRTLLAISRRHHAGCCSPPSPPPSQPHTDEKSINSMFKLDLELLRLLNQHKSPKYKSSSLECAVRILKCIRRHHAELNEDCLNSFNCEEFQRQTLNSWLFVKNNLISLVTSSDRTGANDGDGESSQLPSTWRRTLTGLLKVMVSAHPTVLLYSIIVNRMESQYEPELPRGLSRSNGHLANLSPPGIATFLDSRSTERLDLWRELYEHIKDIKPVKQKSTGSSCGGGGGGGGWREVILETEAFLREMRKISYLYGENLTALSNSVWRKLSRWMERMQKSIRLSGGAFSSEQDRIECEQRLLSIAEHAQQQIEVLLLYCEDASSADLYATWFKADLGRELIKLKNYMQFLAHLPPFESPEKSLKDLASPLAAIEALLYECRRVVSNYPQKLWMHLISPKLSRLEPSGIPMPGCCSGGGGGGPMAAVTIYKVTQTVELIKSKTSPKRLTLLGSDGLERSFLLKAHEDLRHDQFIMDLFVNLNNLLLGDRSTRDICRLRHYSVTPISGKSGLIEWIEAPALSTIYKEWLASATGSRVVENFYASTCRIVCGTAQVGAPKSNHENCRMPHEIHMTGIFYQCLWARAKQQTINDCHEQFSLADTSSNGGGGGSDGSDNRLLLLDRPSRENILRYRAELEPSVFEGVIEQLTDLVPDDLISTSIWLKSINSHSYWLKTKQFTRSCATISMIGYIIGLGDRHLSNILLDHDTGEVIHVDFNLCFELAKELSTPERVPFRLTQNLSRAFGFAGLEGGFTRTSRKVLNLLREHKSTVMHLLDPINWSFMVVQPSSGSPSASSFFTAKPHEDYHHHHHYRAVESAPPLDQPEAPSVWPLESCQKPALPPLPPPRPLEASMANTSENDQQRRWSLFRRLQVGSVIASDDEHERPFLNDLHANIQTPSKLLNTTANKIVKRIDEKLSGIDENLSQIISLGKASSLMGRRVASPLNGAGCHNSNGAQLASSKAPTTMDDLIVLDDALSAEDQVDALIIEACSPRNKAAMYEGWTSWV